MWSDHPVKLAILPLYVMCVPSVGCMCDPPNCCVNPVGVASIYKRWALNSNLEPSTIFYNPLLDTRWILSRVSIHPGWPIPGHTTLCAREGWYLLLLMLFHWPCQISIMPFFMSHYSFLGIHWIPRGRSNGGATPLAPTFFNLDSFFVDSHLMLTRFVFRVWPNQVKICVVTQNGRWRCLNQIFKCT